MFIIRLHLSKVQRCKPISSMFKLSDRKRMREQREQCHMKTWHWTFRPFKAQDNLLATDTTD